MKKVISCASYNGTGSSAITDLISEYNGVKSLTEYEFRFIHDTDGVMDLEYHLVQNPNRLNSGHALKRFWKLSKFNAGNIIDKRYTRFLTKGYLDATKRYIDSLTILKFKGYWFMDLYELGTFRYYMKSLASKIASKLHLSYCKLPNESCYCAIASEEKFLKETRSYINEILKLANPDNADYLMIDQLTPSSNINKCLRYFDDNFCTILVDRDPRDIYVINATKWHDGLIPNTVEGFCVWYDYVHRCNEGQAVDTKKVLKIQFEDIIYKYNNVVVDIENFVGLSSSKHTEKFSKMNPKRSIYNTRLFEKYPKQEDIKYIEEHLKKYLYDFDRVKSNEILGIEPDSTESF